MSIQAVAPTRIDLAGGTIDIWPIYLMLQNPITVNLAINVNAKVILKPINGKKITIRSIDSEEEVRANSLEELMEAKGLPLPIAVIKNFAADLKSNGFELEMDSKSPRGAGIGGSSALLIALISVFLKYCNKKLSAEKLINLARDLEGSVIKVLAGVQDYFPAVRGGLNAIHLLPGEFRLEKISTPLRELTKRMVLCYTGQPRNSGINNWEVTKSFIDGNSTVRNQLEQIAKVANLMRQALIKSNYDEVGKLITKEWEHRLVLAPGISTQLIEQVLSSAKSAGAIGGKVCGAGGGGCLVIYCRPEKKESVSKAATKAGAKVIPFEPSLRGVEVKTI